MGKYYVGQKMKIHCGNGNIQHGSVYRILKRNDHERVEVVWLENDRSKYMYIINKFEDFEESNFEKWEE